jgi:Predicted exonuclease of the beta-lactamase fold involved in RNA processing
MVETGGKKLLVDCGLRQGRDAKAAPVTDGFSFDPREIDAMLLTHAHIDHSGLIPLLVKKGFTGSVYCTDATARLCSIMFPDAGHVQEMEVEWQNRKRLRAGKPEITPIYSVEDALHAVKFLKPLSYEQPVVITDNVTARFVDAGHLLGSASIELSVTEGGKTKKVVFSGDIGNKNKPLIKDPTYLNDADIVFIESTYGDRLHDARDTGEQIKEVLTRALNAGGNIVIPSFAVGRTQELLYEISVLLGEGGIPGLEKVPVYIDSPLGIAATQIFRDSSKGYYDEEAMAFRAEGVEFFSFDTLVVAQTVEESKAINDDPRQKIIISSSGMCDAGRIKHHLKHNLWRADATVIFVGYQAVGTLGRSILDRSKSVKIFGEDIQVRADIEYIEGFSGHADRAGLLEWIGHFPKTLERVFVIHGEDGIAEKFAADLKDLGYNASAPEMFERYDTRTLTGSVPYTAPETEDTLQGLLDRARRIMEGRDAAQSQRMRRELSGLLSRWAE